MKRAFTLIELMIVVMVIAILTGIVFRLMGVSDDTAKRNTTIVRMQRLENCLSGYYAAFGNYPPVALEGRSRDYRTQVNDVGIQQTSMALKNGGVTPENAMAACKAQPVCAYFPFDESECPAIKEVAKLVVKKHNSDDPSFKAFRDDPKCGELFDGLEQPSMLNAKSGKREWPHTQVFQFGLMSYLVPRYLVMMDRGTTSPSTKRAGMYDEFAQWYENNQLPCRFDDGTPYGSWAELVQDLSREPWKVALMPSQQACLRWLPNLEGSCSIGFNCDRVAFSISLKDRNQVGASGCTVGALAKPKLFTAGNSQAGLTSPATQCYVLNSISMVDGWSVELLYYSPAPYQGYRLWSAGPNGATFPPWVSEEEIATLQNANEVRSWMVDDIVHMSY